MSRYVIKKTPEILVVVGFDNPLQTFFSQVFDLKETDEEENVLFCNGFKLKEITTIETLENSLKEYVENIDEHTKNKLEQDYNNRKPPTKLQTIAAKFMENYQ